MTSTDQPPIDSQFLTGILDHATRVVAEAEQTVREAEAKRRIDATLAVRNGMQKSEVASRLCVSRPTLDAWIARVYATPEEIASVEQTEYIVRRESDPATAIHRGR